MRLFPEYLLKRFATGGLPLAPLRCTVYHSSLECFPGPSPPFSPQVPAPSRAVPRLFPRPTRPLEALAPPPRRSRPSFPGCAASREALSRSRLGLRPRDLGVSAPPRPCLTLESGGGRAACAPLQPQLPQRRAPPLPPPATRGRASPPGARGWRVGRGGGHGDSGPSAISHFGGARGLSGPAALTCLGRGLPAAGAGLTFSQAGAGVYNYCPPPRQHRRPGDKAEEEVAERQGQTLPPPPPPPPPCGRGRRRRRRRGFLRGSRRNHERLTGRRRRHGGEAPGCACALGPAHI
ncbi:collagen alpha-1(I) chain-like [Erinaceus europaeus]|uniref:Collagen alpha-1(I) chain-like n=1 Tax=Erinaceus europaeus TaxID=9365 RepID=A0ABM3X6G6_ERIEU|nr:collagen alpha-1(I) chain-like [Erinaceus europaeus]